MLEVWRNGSCLGHSVLRAAPRTASLAVLSISQTPRHGIKNAFGIIGCLVQQFFLCSWEFDGIRQCHNDGTDVSSLMPSQALP